MNYAPPGADLSVHVSVLTRRPYGWQLVFKEFTHVLLLGEGGKTVYWGRSELLVPYLESLGFRNSQNENPADWMIDVCSGLETRFDPATGQETRTRTRTRTL